MQRTVLDFEEELTGLQAEASDTTIAQVLSGGASDTFLTALDDLVRRSCSNGPVYLGYLAAPRLCKDLDLPGIDDAWMAMRCYCGSRMADDLIAAHHLFEILVCVFRPSQFGVWIERGVGEKRNGLFFDDDGLLVGPPGKLKFSKEGILIGSDWLLIDWDVPGKSKNDGFLDDLLKVMQKIPSRPKHFGLAISRDVALSSRYYSECFTKAYIRGPKGLSKELLDDPAFPSDPSGTVTEHRRVEVHPLHALFPLDRTEIMWSERDGIKSIQIEEILPESTAIGSFVKNRYVHARWSPETSRFIHFDGALKSYHVDTYVERLNTDMRKYRSKANGYKKLFRIDAEIDLQSWCSLTTKFFEDNELVLEYMGGAIET